MSRRKKARSETRMPLKLFIFFSLIKIITLNAEQIYVAPILFVDENEERYEADENFQDDLTYELNEKKVCCFFPRFPLEGGGAFLPWMFLI